MEVGAVKQAFNNEVILLKKKLTQAKIQIIHKLTRKAKQLTEKKAPEPLKEKLKRKAESAVKEVLIIKKIKAKDIAKFTVTHKGELNTFLNKPQVDNDKACARLLLHKALQDKYKFIRGRFSNVPIQDLFMSRIERRKLKKEAKEKQKEKRDKKKAKANKVVNSEGDWNVEDVVVKGNGKVNDDDDENAMSGDDGNAMSGDDNEISSDDGGSGDESEQAEVGESSDDENEQAEIGDASDDDNDEKSENHQKDSASEGEDSDSNVKDDVIVKPSPKVKAAIKEVKTKEPESKKPDLPKETPKVIPPKKVVKKNPEKKQKELNKTSKFNEKIHQKKIKSADGPAMETKMVDPFFITSTGENYMSVVEPRAPDEIKDEHMQGNRRLRRAVMFGHVPKSKLRQNNNYHEENRFNKQNNYDNNFKSNFNDRPQYNDRNSFKNDFNNKRGFNNRNDRSNAVEEKPEKLHPSWEAKKKKSGILPFEGKKIVFDDS